MYTFLPVVYSSAAVAKPITPPAKTPPTTPAPTAVATAAPLIASTMANNENFFRDIVPYQD